MQEKGKRQRFWSWLTNKYQLIIRNEENFAEKTTVSFNYAKASLVILTTFTILFVLALFMSRTVLSRWFDPEHGNRQQEKDIRDLRDELDQLEASYLSQHELLVSIQTAFGGGEVMKDSVDLASSSSDNIQEEKLPEIDSIFRAQFESQTSTLVSTEWRGEYEEITDMFFVSPVSKADMVMGVSGSVSRKFDFKEEHYGVDLVAKEGTPIKAVTEGTVISASWTDDNGYVVGVQHKNNVISFYKHNSAVVKKTGDFVKTGDILGIIGNTGDLSAGRHLHFELWYKGSPVNPEYFITF